MKSKVIVLSFLVSLLALLLAGCGGGSEKENYPDRGRYIYDEAGALATESEMSLASYLWRLDSKTDYEIVLVFPQNLMEEEEILAWFNEHGVGKKDEDTGAAVFVFPDNSVFVAIGSGNDKVSVTYSKTYGERIFKDFNDDPVLTLLRFTAALGGEIDKSAGTEVGGTFFESVKGNLNLILLWAAVVALVFFLVQQVDRFQPRDLILPAVVFVVLGIFFGASALGSSSALDTYGSYGVITSAKTGSHPWTHMHLHQVCTSTGKTTTCTTYTTPHGHTMYTNDVTFLSYEFKEYGYRFETDQNRGAWNHEAGELDSLSIRIESGALASVGGLDDNSGGKTIGDGVWLQSAKTK